MGLLADNPEFALHMAEIVKALGHPIRLRTIAMLCSGEDSVNNLALRIGVGQAVLSQQLRILRMAGLVTVVRKNGFAVYGLAESRLESLIACLESCTLFKKEAV